MLGDSEDEELAQRLNGAQINQPARRIWRRLSEHFDPLAAGVSLVLFFVVLFIFAIVETYVPVCCLHVDLCPCLHVRVILIYI